MKTSTTSLGLAAVFLSSVLAARALAQSSQQGQSTPHTQTSQTQMSQAQSSQTDASQNSDTTPATGKADATDNTTYATGKPLEGQSKEGFWGHMNPFARKKWVNRQVDPIHDRTNELDQLQSKNRNDIRDVDSRAQAGIRKANSAAAMADQHAVDAGNRANAANTLAGNASTQTEALNGTVSNLDQYKTVSATSVPFSAGRTTLGPKAKADLDQVASQLASEKGYILDVQGYSRAGVQHSQAMADAVVRYLVTEHQVPIYRIYKSGLGKAQQQASADGEKPLTNGVRVTLLHNSLATMGNTTARAGAPAAYPATQGNAPSNQ